MNNLSNDELIEEANLHDETSVLFFNRNPKAYLRRTKNLLFLKLNRAVSKIDAELYRRLTNKNITKKTLESETESDSDLDESEVRQKKNRARQDKLDQPRQITSFMTDAGMSVSAPFQRMQADVGNMKWTKQFGYYYHGYLLVIVDVYSRKTYLFAMKESGAKEVAETFERFFDKIGQERERFNENITDTLQLQTDKGGEFYNPTVGNLFREYKVDHYSTSANEGKAFVAEQKLREIKRLVRQFYERGLVKQKGKSKAHDWAQLVPKLERALNNKRNVTFGLTPEQMMTSSSQSPVKQAVMHWLRNRSLKRVNRAMLLRDARKKMQATTALRPLKVGDTVYVLARRQAKKRKVGLFVKATTHRREFWDTSRVYEIIKRVNNARNDTPSSVGPLYTYSIRDLRSGAIKKGRYYREELHPFTIADNTGGDKRYLREFIEKETA